MTFKTPTFAQIQVGDTLPELQLPPVDRTTLALFAGASGAHNPMHIDIDVARRAGMPDVFAQGMLGMAWLGRVVTNWAPQSQLRQFDVRLHGTAPLGMYVIYDDLDPSLTFTGASIKINTTDLVRCTAVNTPANCDYTVYTASGWGVNATAWDGNPVANGPVVTIVFSDAGLTELEANRAYNVFTTLNTTVNKEDADGIVPNTSSFIPNEQWWNQNGTTTVNPETPTTTPPTTPPGIPSNEVKTKYGDLVITKLDPKATTPAADMAGAEFAVYIDPTPTTGCTADDVIGTPVKTGVIPTTTGVDNTLTIKGLQTSDFYNNTQYTAEQSDMFIKYCLVETKAPEGYNLNAEAIQFTILVPATVTNLASTALTVYNELKNLGNNLPLTGGAGVAAFSTLGLLLVGGGMAYYVVTSRRRREQDI